MNEICDQMRADIKKFPEIAKYNVSTGQSGMGGQSMASFEIYGYDFEVTDRVAKMIQEGMLAKGGCAQVLISRDEYTPEYQVDFDREKLAINGLNTTTAASYFSSAMNGSTQSFYREDGDEYDIRVRYAPEF